MRNVALIVSELPGLDGERRPLGQWQIGAVTSDDVEKFKEVRIAEHAADLPFHDLHREAGSADRGAGASSLLKEFLGYGDLTTTSTYLAITRTGMHQVMRQNEQRRKRARRPAASASAFTASV